MKTDSSTEPALLEVPPAWHVRETVQHLPCDSKGRKQGKMIFELVWGTTEQDANKISRIVGTVYHVLTGPTAKASMDAYAENLRKRGVVPPDPMPKTRADGFRQTRNTNTNGSYTD